MNEPINDQESSDETTALVNQRGARMIPPRTELLTLLQSSGYGYIEFLEEMKLLSGNRRRNV